MRLKDIKKKMVVKSTCGMYNGQEGVVKAVGPVKRANGRRTKPVVTVTFEDGDEFIDFHKFPEDLELIMSVEETNGQQPTESDQA